MEDIEKLLGKEVQVKISEKDLDCDFNTKWKRENITRCLKKENGDYFIIYKGVKVYVKHKFGKKFQSNNVSKWYEYKPQNEIKSKIVLGLLSKEDIKRIKALSKYYKINIFIRNVEQPKNYIMKNHKVICVNDEYDKNLLISDFYNHELISKLFYMYNMK